MSKPTEQRPPQVSLASGIVMFASVLVLITAWDQVASLGSLETQEAIDSFLAEPPYSSLGLDLAATRDLLRLTSLVAAGAACATAHPRLVRPQARPLRPPRPHDLRGTGGRAGVPIRWPGGRVLSRPVPRCSG